jgi:hypothetical protein
MEGKLIKDDKSDEKDGNKKSSSKPDETSADESRIKEKSPKKQETYQNIKVLVRVRPFIKNEIEKGNVVFVNPRVFHN